MSQAKVDKYKQEKKNRKNPKKTSKVKKAIPYVITGIIVILIFGYLGISVAKQTGLYTTPTEPKSWNEQEIQSLRQVLIQATDPNVKYTTAKQEQQTPVASQKIQSNKKADAKTNQKATVKTTKKSAKK